MLPSQDRTGKSTTYPSSTGWHNTCCDKKYHRISYQGVNCEFARLVESAATKQQTAELARQVNGVTDVINNLHMQAES